MNTGDMETVGIEPTQGSCHDLRAHVRHRLWLAGVRVGLDKCADAAVEALAEHAAGRAAATPDARARRPRCDTVGLHGRADEALALTPTDLTDPHVGIERAAAGHARQLTAGSGGARPCTTTSGGRPNPTRRTHCA